MFFLFIACSHAAPEIDKIFCALSCTRRVFENDFLFASWPKPKSVEGLNLIWSFKLELLPLNDFDGKFIFMFNRFFIL